MVRRGPRAHLSRRRRSRYASGALAPHLPQRAPALLVLGRIDSLRQRRRNRRGPKGARAPRRPDRAADDDGHGHGAVLHVGRVDVQQADDARKHARLLRRAAPRVQRYVGGRRRHRVPTRHTEPARVSRPLRLPPPLCARRVLPRQFHARRARRHRARDGGRAADVPHGARAGRDARRRGCRRAGRLHWRRRVVGCGRRQRPPSSARGARAPARGLYGGLHRRAGRIQPHRLAAQRHLPQHLHPVQHVQLAVRHHRRRPVHVVERCARSRSLQ